MRILPLIIALAACSTESAPPSPELAAPVAPAPTVVQPSEGWSLALNDGAQWQTDEHTRGVMDETRAALAAADPATVEEAVAVGTTLQEQVDRMIEGCTMDGADHDALHSFLVVYIPAMKALGTSTELDAAKAQIAELNAMVAEYDRAFE